MPNWRAGVQGPQRKRERRKRGGLNKTEERQVKTIAKQQIRGRSELKHRRWLYPKTTYSELKHNESFFLFGGGGNSVNGLLNLAKGDDSVMHPNGGALPGTAPGECRSGQQVRLRRLVQHCILSGDGANKNTHVRMIMFSYPTSNNNVQQNDILLEPFGTGVGQGFPLINLPKNVVNNVGVKFLMDRTYSVNGTSSGAYVIEEAGIPAPNWGLSGVRTFQFTKNFKNGKVIKYVENPSGADSPIPAIDNIGILVIPYGSGVTPQGETCGRLELWGDMEFYDR